MPRYYGQGTSVEADERPPNQFPSIPEIDVLQTKNRGSTFYTRNVWLSDSNSFSTIVGPSVTQLGDPDHISGWDTGEIRVATIPTATFSTLQYEISLDGGKTFPIIIPISISPSGFAVFPLMGQLGRLRWTTSSTWPSNGILQIALFYRRSESGNGFTVMGETSHPNDLIPASTNAINVKVVNNWEDDYITGKVGSRRTGACAGYSDDIGATFQSVTNIPSGFLPLPGSSGVVGAKIASTSTQDSAGGTGISLYIFQFMNTDFSLTIELVVLNGTTPVNLATSPIYRFVIGFPVSGGSTYNALTTVGSNRGAIYLGTGAFSTTTGFATNYMVNRVDDGVIVTPTYTVPLGTRGLLYELKYAAEASKPVIFRTYGRSSATAPWSLQIEDITVGTIQPRRSLIGGWLAPGGEWTVIGKRSSGTNVLANFIMTIIEVQESIFNSYIP